MRLSDVYWDSHGLGEKDGRNVIITAVALGRTGPKQSMFLIPVRSDHDQEPQLDRWGLVPSFSGKPALAANIDDTEGTIIRLSSFDRPGKRLGHLFLAYDQENLDHLMSVGYGIGGTEDGSVTWEESLFMVRGEARFVVNYTSGADAIITVSGKEVTHEIVSPRILHERMDSELLRLDDNRIPRWHNSQER